MSDNRITSKICMYILIFFFFLNLSKNQGGDNTPSVRLGSANLHTLRQLFPVLFFNIFHAKFRKLYIGSYVLYSEIMQMPVCLYVCMHVCSLLNFLLFLKRNNILIVLDVV